MTSLENAHAEDVAVSNELEKLNHAELNDADALEDEAVDEQQSRQRLPFAFAKRHGVAVVERQDGYAVVNYHEHTKASSLQEVRRWLDCPIRLTQIPSENFEAVLAAVYQNNSSETMQMMDTLGDEMDLSRISEELQETEDLLETEDDAPIIKLINALLTEAIKINASDIHIETFEKAMVVRFRVDGVLREILRPNRKLASLLVSRIKVMAKLDIAEKRVPQDGRIALKIAGRAVDVRVSTMPSSQNERVVLRLLDKQAGRLTLNSLGMYSVQQEVLEDLLFKPHGIILVTGPTGSGKTTTLYAGLTKLNSPTRNILTVEDPVEYILEGIGQTQVNTKVDMTFAKGLRAMLRQDPDVVMVGEIRDLETAQIAVQASLTGHLVLSTLHTNTAIGAVTRLRDMGIEPFLLASSLLGVLAQRLVRKLCPDCKQPFQPSDSECLKLDLDVKNKPTLFKAVGCEKCNYSGYQGRQGIYELISVDDELRTMIHDGISEHEMLEHARKHSKGIRHDGRQKVLEGITTIEEVLRVTRED